MTMQSFDEAVANFVAPGAAPLAELKKTFEPTLAELRDLQRAYPKKEAAWLARGAVVQARQHKALAKGIRHFELGRDLQDLYGGRSLSAGLIQDTKQQIEGSIYKIEHLSERDLPFRNLWLSWYGEPQRIRDNMSAIERLMGGLEIIVKDGGELQQRIEAKSMQPAAATLAPTPPREAEEMKVEKDFSV